MEEKIKELQQEGAGPDFSHVLFEGQEVPKRWIHEGLLMNDAHGNFWEEKIERILAGAIKKEFENSVARSKMKEEVMELINQIVDGELGEEGEEEDYEYEESFEEEE